MKERDKTRTMKGSLSECSYKIVVQSEHLRKPTFLDRVNRQCKVLALCSRIHLHQQHATSWDVQLHYPWLDVCISTGKSTKM